MPHVQPPRTMRCPKCGFEQPTGQECRQCGLLFAKYRPRPAAALSPGGADPAAFPVAKSNHFSRYVAWLMVVWVVLMGVAYFQQRRLPGRSAIVAELYQAPIQTPVALEPFQVEAGDNSYTVTPLYQYELNGLVVSYHRSGTLWDIYHDAWQDFINIKDLCVVWGDNIDSEVYQRMDFKSGTWTCWYRWKDRATGALFDNTALSNNHLLAADPGINREILKATLGDQIYFKGYLAEYANNGSDFRRGTSTTRTDTGNGACETVFVEEFKILKRAHPLWKWILVRGWWVLLGGLALWVACVVREAQPR